MKLLGTKPLKKPLTAEGSYIKELPRRQVTVDRQNDDKDTGNWFEGRVLFISNEEAIIVPTRARATNIYGAVGRMTRVAKPGLPKKMRKGNDKRIHTILVEIVEHRRKK